MKPNHTVVSSKRNPLQNSEPRATTSFIQRERVRRSKLATIAILISMLFLLTLLPQAVINTNPALIMALFIGLGACTAALSLNWRGFVGVAGILTLSVVYAIGTLTMLHYPDGLTVNNLYLLDLTIIPDVLVLAFFSANSLLPIVCINALQAGAILLFGPHDNALTHLLHTTPMEIFSHVYILQLITAVVLYLWARNTEQALAHADQSQEAKPCEQHEKEWQKKELEKKRQLDDGIQQILQTHVAVANGDLNARAPLLQDHELWQVAGALNNLIARHQSLSHTERKLRQQIWGENLHTTDQFPRYDQATGGMPRYEQATGGIPRYDQAASGMPKYTGHDSPSREVPPGSFGTKHPTIS